MKLDIMSAEKTSHPVEVINVSTLPASDATKTSSKLTKKHVLIAIVSLIAVGLAVACVLVAIRLYSDSEKEIVKYSLMYQGETGSAINQTVSVAGNSVMYHVVQDGLDEWVVNDFDRLVQVVKMMTAEGYVACFATPLNMSRASTPDSVPSVAPTTNQVQSVVYSILKDPIADITFLGTRVSDMCNNVPAYWIVEYCNNAVTPRVKRSPGGPRTSYDANVNIKNVRDSVIVVVIIQGPTINING